MIGGIAPDPGVGVPAVVDLKGAPVQLPAGSRNSSISAGLNHTCAIVEIQGAPAGTGAVRCWGHGQRGQLGDGVQLDSAAPVGVVSR